MLYAEGNGAPNASIRVLVGMMILKEGQGWSDRQLFFEYGYNLLTRSALELMSLENAESVPSTYYLFRRNLVLFKKHDYGRYGTLKALFEQQYTISEDKTVIPLEKEKVSAKSIQSPHDPDCHYRNKDGNRIKGYAVNVTETCDRAEDGEEPMLNLVTDTRVTVV